MPVVEAPPRSPEQDELDALIEEARRRARRRRLGYAALVAAAIAAAGSLYLAFSGGGGTGGGGSPRGNANSGGAAGPSSERPASGSRESTYQRRCPGRGLQALPLTPTAVQSARTIAGDRVGPPPRVTTSIRPAMHAGFRGEAVSSMCGPKIARRTLVVFTWDHYWDNPRHRSASLAQHAFLVSRFGDGYHVWYWEH